MIYTYGPRGSLLSYFFTQEDRDQTLKGGPYFFFSSSLYLRPWKERFNSEKEDMTVALVWIWFYSLPCESWDIEILQYVGEMLGEFMKVVDQTKQ